MINSFRKKMLLILLFLCFTTGCQVSSDLTINKDLSVKEELNMTGTSEFFDNHYRNFPITVVENMLDSQEREEKLVENGYFYEIKKDKRYPYVYATKNYASLLDYANNTIFKKQYFEDLIVETNNNLVTLKSKDFIVYEEGEDIDRYSIKSFSLNIKLPYVVTSHNADKVDKSENIYTWNINIETKEKEINITFDKDRVYVYNMAMYISIIILCLLGVVLIIVTLGIVKKHKINNIISE